MHTSSCFQCWQRSEARLPRGCTATITTSLENKSVWSDLSSLQCKNTEGEHGGRSCLWQKYASCGLWLYQQIYHSSETTSKKQINIFHFIYSPSEPMWEAFVFLSKKNFFLCKTPWMKSRFSFFSFSFRNVQIIEWKSLDNHFIKQFLPLSSYESIMTYSISICRAH